MLVYWRVYPQEWNTYEKMNQFVQNDNRKRRERTVRNQQIMGAKKNNLYHPGNAFLYFGGVTKLLCLHIASPLVPHKLAPLDHTWRPR